MSLNTKQMKFAMEYVKCQNASQAAIRAGYSEKTAGQIGSRLLKNVEIQALTQQKVNKILGDLDVSVERVLKERARLAFFNPKRLFTNDGKPIPIHELDDDTAAALAGLDVYRERSHTEGDGDDRTDTELVEVAETVKYKLADKNASLTALEKHLGMYKEDEAATSPLNITIVLG